MKMQFNIPKPDNSTLIKPKSVSQLVYYATVAVLGLAT